MLAEEKLAARHGGYTWPEYARLPGCDAWIDPNDPVESKSMVLAVYRMDNQIQAIANDPPKQKKKGLNR